MASIGKDAVEEAAKIAAAEGQEHVVWDVQELLMEKEQTPGRALGSGATIEEKIPVQTMDPSPHLVLRQVKEICPRGNNKVVILYFLIS